MERISFP